MNDQLSALLRGLYVSGAGGRKTASYPLESLNRRILKTFAVVYIYKGSGLFQSGPTGTIPVSEGTVFFLFPGVWHQYGVESNSSWSEYWMLFEGFIPERYCASGLLNPERPLFSLGYDAEVIQLFQKAKKEFAQNLRGSGQRLGEYLFAVLGRVFSRARIQDRHAEQERRQVMEIIKLMEKSLSEPSFSLKRYERTFSSSYSALRKRFRRLTGYPPARYFDMLKISRAKTRLLATRDLVKTIGSDLGYEDQYHFSRRFKALVGVSPENFRKEFSQKE